MAITLPEITIEGNPRGTSETAADWWCDGFMLGWNNPQAAKEPPAPGPPLNDECLNSYYQGIDAGRNARRGVEDKFVDYDGPAIDVDPGGEFYEEAERKWREAWQEFLRHEDPHSEQEPPEIVFE